MFSSSIPLALVTNTTVARLTQVLFDNTFAGIHQLGWFDWALLIPYFSILVVLSVYGLHRYDVIRTYFQTPQEGRHRARRCASSNFRA